MDIFSLNERLVEESKKDGIQRLVVGAVIRSDNKILLLKRSKDDFMSGIYELSSGKVEHGENLLEALNREVNEETSLEIREILRYIGYFDYLSKSGKKTRQFNFLVEVIDAKKITLSEHESYVWCLISELKKYNVSEEVEQIIGKI